jgi:protein-tyrosine phosphatase
VSFTTYFICTGNQARSVIAEHSFRRATEGLDVTVVSAGLYRPDAPALPEMATAAEAHGLDLTAHRSRNFATENLADADLIIGFERQHIATVVVDGNADPAKTFMLKELARLLEDIRVNVADPIDRARTVIATAHRARVAATAFFPGEEMADPVGREKDFFEETAGGIVELTTALAKTLFGERAGHGGAPEPQPDPTEETSRRIWGTA